MTCPICNGETRVTCTRDSNDNVIRYRKCRVCGHLFRTVETDEDIYQRLRKGQTLDGYDEESHSEYWMG